jgi:hypothetical protein
MDELRIWKTELTPAQIRQMMNQEIKKHTAMSRVVSVLSVPGLSWSNLDGYYQMNKATDILNGMCHEITSPLFKGG